LCCCRRDECPVQGMLMTGIDMFEQIHSSVFAGLEQAAAAAAAAGAQNGSSSGSSPGAVWDVRDILEQRRRKVLEGVVIAFSRVIPLEMAAHTHSLWRLAEAFGARCSTQLSPEVTHVVAMSRATEKVGRSCAGRGRV
jgi:hypothetical protein